MATNTGIKKVIKIQRLGDGAPRIFEVTMTTQKSPNSKVFPTHPADFGRSFPRQITPSPSRNVLPAPLKTLKLPKKPKITMDNLSEWVDEDVSLLNSSKNSSVNGQKRKFREIPEPAAKKISDLNNAIKEIEKEKKEHMAHVLPKSTLSPPKVIKIVRVNQKVGLNEETSPKAIFKVVKPIVNEGSTKVESPPPTLLPSSTLARYQDPPPLKNIKVQNYRYYCVKCQKRFIRINGSPLPTGKERAQWCERLCIPEVETTSSYALICSDHFNAEDVYETRDGEKRAIKGSIPKAVKIKPVPNGERKKYPRLGCVKCKKRFDLVNGACFPKRDAEIQLWKKLLDLGDGMKVNFKTVVCAEHFHEKDIYVSRNGERRVIAYALPKDHRVNNSSLKDKIEIPNERLKKILLKSIEESAGDEPSDTEIGHVKKINSARPFFRCLPRYTAAGEVQTCFADSKGLENTPRIDGGDESDSKDAQKPCASSMVVKQEPLSDKEDEEEKLTRQKEVKILEKRKEKKVSKLYKEKAETRSDFSKVRIKEEPVEPEGDMVIPSKVIIKEEPMDFDERVDEPFVVEPSHPDEYDMFEECAETTMTSLEMPLLPSEHDEPVLFSVSQAVLESDPEDKNPEETEIERIQTLALGLFASPKKVSMSPGPNSMSKKGKYAKRMLKHKTPIPSEDFLNIVIELLPNAIKESVRRVNTMLAYDLVGIMHSAKGDDHYFCVICGNGSKFESNDPLQEVIDHVKMEIHKQMFKLYEKCYSTMKCTQTYRGIHSSTKDEDLVYCNFCYDYVSLGRHSFKRSFLLTSHILSRPHFENFLSSSKVALKKAEKMGIVVEIKEQTKKPKCNTLDDVSFKDDYTENYIGISSSEKGPKYFRCKLCKLDLTLEKSGEHAIFVHTRKPRHQKALRIYTKNAEWMNKKV